MKQKVTSRTNQSYVDIMSTLNEMIENGAEIVQLVNAGTQFDWPDWVIIYKE
tara:strand:+ start:171 stop:326 length:156 start_codon:yes stop_codon:yes gene_type:complete